MDAFSASLVQAYWPIILSTIIFIGWGARLEAKFGYLEKDRGESRESASARETVLWIKLDTLQITVTELVREVAKLQGKIENR